MGQSGPRFVYFCPFLIVEQQTQIQFQKDKIETSADGLLGIRTRDIRMVRADETTELWWLPNLTNLFVNGLQTKRRGPVANLINILSG